MEDLSELAMDITSIVQLIEEPLTLYFQYSESIKTLNDIAERHSYIKVIITSLLQSLYTFQLAWSQIVEWLQRYIPNANGDSEGFLQRV